jgi:predicted ATP-dependent endonuclease of OLD family
VELTKVHVTNFRSVEDSGEFDVGQTLCLVGKNEAGKTAVLQALAGLNPHPLTPVTYDVERDYPRRWLTEYSKRHPKTDEPATVITTKWKLSNKEKEFISAEIGDALQDKPITVYRRYGDSEPQWDLPIDYRKAVANLLASAKLNEEERQHLDATANTDELRKALEAIKEPTSRQKHLLERLSAYPNKNVWGFVTDKLKLALPHFMFGQIRLDTYEARSKKQQPPPIEPGELVFIDFLEYAGTSLQEITTAATYESLNARCESASSRITEQLLDYWTQNPNLEIEVRVTKAEPKDPPPFN